MEKPINPLRSKGTVFALIILGGLLAFSCKKKEDREYRSEAKAMGNGTVYSWITTDYKGKPKALGFTMSAPALEGLAQSGPGHESHNAWELQLMPSVASKTPFRHIVVNWNPEGHMPLPVYKEGHFDFHFYTMTSAERKKIPVWSADSAAFKNLPPADYIPVNYISPGELGAELEMGMHLIDKNSPEVAGTGPFTYHFVYGSYNGKVNFLEPMITYNLFKSMADFSADIPRPAKVITPGYYPTRIRVFQKDGNYTMSLEDMEYRNAE